MTRRNHLMLSAFDGWSRVEEEENVQKTTTREFFMLQQLKHFRMAHSPERLRNVLEAYEMSFFFLPNSSVNFGESEQISSTTKSTMSQRTSSGCRKIMLRINPRVISEE